MPSSSTSGSGDPLRDCAAAEGGREGGRDCLDAGRDGVDAVIGWSPVLTGLI